MKKESESHDMSGKDKIVDGEKKALRLSMGTTRAKNQRKTSQKPKKIHGTIFLSHDFADALMLSNRFCRSDNCDCVHFPEEVTAAGVLLIGSDKTLSTYRQRQHSHSSLRT